MPRVRYADASRTSYARKRKVPAKYSFAECEVFSLERSYGHNRTAKKDNSMIGRLMKNDCCLSSSEVEVGTNIPATPVSIDEEEVKEVNDREHFCENIIAFQADYFVEKNGKQSHFRTTGDKLEEIPRKISFEKVYEFFDIVTANVFESTKKLSSQKIICASNISKHDQVSKTRISLCCNRKLSPTRQQSLNESFRYESFSKAIRVIASLYTTILEKNIDKFEMYAMRNIFDEGILTSSEISNGCSKKRDENLMCILDEEIISLQYELGQLHNRIPFSR